MEPYSQNIGRFVGALKLTEVPPAVADKAKVVFLDTLGVALACLAGLAALGTEGWRLPLWSAGLAVAALGAASIAFPSEASSFPLVGAILAIAWGATFIWLGNRKALAAIPQQKG